MHQHSRDDVVRDATIQRFEFTFEAAWKALKTFLEDKHGIVCQSPKSCFREALSISLLSVDQVEQGLEMTDDRNLTTHTYHEELANQIYQRILENHMPLLTRLWNAILSELS
jgi:nucleotidyltransferase substrate binding protein (TIGR01987 family)